MADDFLSDEDKALFRASMRTVKPLNKKTKTSVSPIPPTKKIPQEHKKQEKKEYYLSDFIVDTVLSESILSYCHPSISHQRFKEFKNGLIRWQARLDLHGLKSETARVALCQFIQDQFQNNKRCLLIIHGKAGRLGSPPVIKNLINRWLPQFDEVLAFHSALPKDGGTGAVYVLLRKGFF